MLGGVLGAMRSRLPNAGMSIFPVQDPKHVLASSAVGCALGRDCKRSLKSSNHRAVLSAGPLGVIMDTFTTDSGAIRIFYSRFIGSAPRSSQLGLQHVLNKVQSSKGVPFGSVILGAQARLRRPIDILVSHMKQSTTPTLYVDVMFACIRCIHGQSCQCGSAVITPVATPFALAQNS